MALDSSFSIYLHDLDVAEAVESFTRLADKLLLQENQDQSWQNADLCGFCPIDAGWRDEDSRPADRTSPSWSTSSARSSLGPASVASSCGSSVSDNPYSSANGRRRSKGGNASAANRYRNRLNQLQSKLMDQLEREKVRNERLKRDLEAKLSLYREFVSLLAHNTGLNDPDLASLGSRSLSSVLSSCLCYEGTCLDDQVIRDLESKLGLFQRILANGGGGGGIGGGRHFSNIEY